MEKALNDARACYSARRQERAWNNPIWKGGLIFWGDENWTPKQLRSKIKSWGEQVDTASRKRMVLRILAGKLGYLTDGKWIDQEAA